jgi:hypothetical protein
MANARWDGAANSGWARRRREQRQAPDARILPQIAARCLRIGLYRAATAFDETSRQLCNYII